MEEIKIVPLVPSEMLHLPSPTVPVPTAAAALSPAPATTFAHLDATTVLSRSIVELGIYPAVDPLESTSRILDPRVVGEEHYEVARLSLIHI